MDSERKPLVKIAAEQAADVPGSSELTPEARQLMTAELSPADFLEALTNADLLPDAIRFLAHALPKLDAIRWACDAAETSGQASDAERHCLEAARKWTNEQSEDNRRAALVAADRSNYPGAAGWAAAAAGWSGGSMAPPELEDVPPPEHLTGTAVASSVLLASVAREPHLVKQIQSELLKVGLELASEP